MEVVKEVGDQVHAGSGGAIARTRSTGVTFKPPKTHDMVRSLFDPTVKKSFLEVCIFLVLLSNFVTAYKFAHWFGVPFTKNVYLLQYIFWRLCYNVGIGIVLHYQSHYETLTRWAREHRWFDKGNKSKLAQFLQFEIKSKLVDTADVYRYPEELNVWLIFRQFVDLILMQDFDTYVIYVYLSMPSHWADLVNWRSLVGVALIVFNVWVKLDAHRVVKDYAWYWGDFFFLLNDSELVFDGVFNISPHPMYSIGYLGYYGVSLICGDYKVLLVSILGHFLQFQFLKYVETPHIERTYGVAADDEAEGKVANNHQIDDLIAKENYDYSRPLISIGVWFNNFDKLRVGDLFTAFTVTNLLLWFVFHRPSNTFLLWATFMAKFTSWSLITFVLFKQSKEKWFTKLYLRNGYTQVYSYQQWQFLYNFTQTVTYVLLVIQTFQQAVNVGWDRFNYSKLIFGMLLCALQVWCNTEIRDAISDFGWFYGDFFLGNYINTRRLTSQGIYRYLNNPETILGVAGVWGTVLITDFRWENITLALLWTLTNFVLVKFIEKPHIVKVYGDANRVSGVGKTLLSLKPLRRVSEIVDNVEHIILRSLLYDNTGKQMSDTSASVEGDGSKTRDDPLSVTKRRNNVKDWEHVVQSAVRHVTTRLAPHCEFDISFATRDGSVVLPETVTLLWRLPQELYNERDWIGLYNVLDTKNNREVTRVSSHGHWTPALASDSQVKEHAVSGEAVFDFRLLVFRPGIYEFRYHSNNSHKVLMISEPFEVALPSFDMASEERFRTELVDFLKSVRAFKSGHFDFQNGNLTVRELRDVILHNVGVELTCEYIKRVNGDVSVISDKAWHIKSILEELP
ncbi:phosphatidylethanolamine N-methyltransferase KNAG_0J02690 [Huiozyma naganishii CBS 8797]|uniref:Phosphatidylethanolamine N-methyltransferase n=1 Tax=Huiozyma naganishii (strain ATCC MYA-139 / BCRC 22969 / CBS 8797 / KCTC 17520 / NBRC 10181 / NCYC 3082 / Yp74L-3) TaxID=1071383 RepID=J7RR72_HUIN7|nr:hypothetical protein KNAG_0J02690 [Kazachstania naganishii CBS 8797]CCK72348.1 hypothetical protein KNAG_0J02690 [Kazachstania naganishii CBS 8797]